MTEQIIFLAILFIAGYILWKRIASIKTNIQLGKKTKLTGTSRQRWKNVWLVALGQKKMFNKIIPAILHLWIYIGFLVINLEVLEVLIDGTIGTHRFFSTYIGKSYPLLISVFELFAIAVFISCIIFLARRNILKIQRLRSLEMTTWPRWDANIILIAEIILVVSIFVMHATDQVLQIRHTHYPHTGTFFFSHFLMPFFSNTETTALIYIERGAWWAHIIGILGFAVYITYSKHLHIFLAFPNVYYARIKPGGHMQNMPMVTHEVKSILGIETTTSTTKETMETFGAKDINDLSRASLLSAYACTECGRCTSECPANLTGKALSPRKIMMDIRDRLTEVGNTITKKRKGKKTGKTLLDDYITREEINACTSCNACVEACPILINPLDIILELRRYIAMEEAGSPAPWNTMFQNIETNAAPWKFPSTDRIKWADELQQNPSNS